MPIMRRQGDPNQPEDTLYGVGADSREIDNEEGGVHEQGHPTRESTQADVRQEEKMTLLGLPAPNDQMGLWRKLDHLGLAPPTMLWVRGVKSTILFLKVCSLMLLVYPSDSISLLQGVLDRKHLPRLPYMVSHIAHFAVHGYCRHLVR